MIATFSPVGSLHAGTGTLPALSTAIFLSPLMLTGASISVLLHLFSHGCSHIYAHVVGSGLSLLIRRTASAYLPSCTSAMYPGISTPAGHDFTHATGWLLLHEQNPLSICDLKSSSQPSIHFNTSLAASYPIAQSAE